MLNGDLGIGVPIFFTLTACSPTSLGAKLMPDDADDDDGHGEI
jgi:hypothetical protein